MDYKKEETKVNVSYNEKADNNVESIVQLAQDIEEAKYIPWTASMFKLYAVLCVAYLCGRLDGFDGSLMGGINAMTSYQQAFNLGEASSGTGLVFAIYNIVAIPAVFCTGPVNDVFGRRMGMFTGALTVIIGTCIQASACSMGQFLAGRCILGLHHIHIRVELLLASTTAPDPNDFRRYIGSIIAGWVIVGCEYIDSDNAFRIPIWCQLITSALVVIAVWFIPESPRRLISNDRHEDAANVVARFHGQGDIDHPVVVLQLKEMTHQFLVEPIDKNPLNYSMLWDSHAARRRMLCVIGMGLFGQLSGNSAIGYYLPVMAKTADIDHAHTQLILKAVHPIICIFAAAAGARMTDVIGRRPLLLYSIFLCAASFLVHKTRKPRVI